MKTTSYEISKRLNEAGFKGGSDCCYLYDGRLIRDGQEFGYHPTICDGESIVDCFSYDLETILEALPNFIENKNRRKGENLFYKSNCLIIDVAFGKIHYEGDSDNDAMFITTTEENESLADTAAKLWLKLKKEGLV